MRSTAACAGACLLLATLLLIPSATAADVVDLTFPATLSQMRMTLDGSLNGTDAAGLRDQMDRMGDHDGQVSQSEADAATTQLRDSVAEPITRAATGNVTMDGAGPTHAELTEFRIDNATGAIDAPTPIGIHFQVTMDLTPDDGAEHLLVLHGDPSASGPADATRGSVHAPPGWVIQHTSGVPGAQLSSDQTSLTFYDDATNHADSLVVFARAPASSSTGHASPLVAPAVLLGVLAMTAAIVEKARSGRRR